MGKGLESRTGTTLHLLLHDPMDPKAWSRFVERYGSKVAGWCRKWQLQEADVQEVTQNVLVKLVEKMRTFVYDPRGSFHAWLKTVTQHALSDYLKKRGPDKGSGDSRVADKLDSVPAREELCNDLEDEFEREMLEEAMARARLRVKPDTWKAFQYTALEKRSGSEVAAQLKMTVDAVFKARSRVQQMLKEEIKKLGGSTRD